MVYACEAKQKSGGECKHSRRTFCLSSFGFASLIRGAALFAAAYTAVTDAACVLPLRYVRGGRGKHRLRGIRARCAAVLCTLPRC